jgi:hypothetical protein
MCKIDITLSCSEASDLCGQDYFDILDYVTEICDSVSLVTQKSNGLSANGHLILEKLHPFINEISDAESWPGTKLFGHTARLYKYAYNRDVASLLKSVTSCLFNWIQPDYPEDLCLYRPDGSVWMTTISHERDGYLSITPVEIADIKVKLPSLHALLLI